MKFKNCQHYPIIQDGRTFCTRCLKFDIKDLEEGRCIHDLTFLDGFSVCVICGICAENVQEYAYNTLFLPIEKTSKSEIEVNLEDVLYNNNIYGIAEIYEEYIRLKTKVNKKIPNTYVYAYCVYMYIRGEYVLTSMEYIADIFCIDVKKLKRAHSFILNLLNINENVNTYVTPEYYFSLVTNFLKAFNLLHILKSVLKTIESVGLLIESRPNILAVGAIYYVIKKSKLKFSIKDLSLYFRCSVRTILNTKCKVTRILGDKTQS